MAGPPYNIYDYIYLSHRFNCGSLSHLYCHTEDKHKLLVSDTPGFLYHPSVYDWYIQIYSPHFLYKSYTSHLLLEDKQITHPCQYYRCMTPYFARILADLARFSLNSLSIFWRSHDDSWQDALAGRVNLQECGPIFIFASKILSKTLNLAIRPTRVVTLVFGEQNSYGTCRTLCVGDILHTWSPVILVVESVGWLLRQFAECRSGGWGRTETGTATGSWGSK